jgi:hypothetical protein
MWWVLAACSGSGTDTPEDTGTPLPPACAWSKPCVGDLAAAEWHTTEPGAALGYDLATDGQVVVAGAPAPFGALPSGAVHVFGVEDLAG